MTTPTIAPTVTHVCRHCGAATAVRMVVGHWGGHGANEIRWYCVDADACRKAAAA